MTETTVYGQAAATVRGLIRLAENTWTVETNRGPFDVRSFEFEFSAVHHSITNLHGSWRLKSGEWGDPYRRWYADRSIRLADLPVEVRQHILDSAQASARDLASAVSQVHSGDELEHCRTCCDHGRANCDAHGHRTVAS